MTRSSVGLLMRKGLSLHGDHIEALGRIFEEVHLWTSVSGFEQDPRFRSVQHIPKHENVEEMITQARQIGVPFFITWQETDIVLNARLNEGLGRQDIPLQAAEIARDKSRQRQFLKQEDVACPEFYAVNTLDEAVSAATSIGYPVIIKPTLAASSSHVALVHSLAELKRAFDSISQLAISQSGLYFDEEFPAIALIEEFLPGEEITLDGVVVNGRFYLGGVHNKLRMPGPYFEEDEYTLPFQGESNVEQELCEMAQQICTGLKLENGLFNVEARQNANDEYKVVEFSCRISGGHVYRNIRDVYGIDLVTAHAYGLQGEETLAAHFAKRTAPKCATCIKFVYRDGKVLSNASGEAADDVRYRAYYPVAAKGRVVQSAPNGFDITGLLSVRTQYEGPEDIESVKQAARSLEQKLDLQVAEVRQLQ
ncbi:ATP-grasp domain-containing protein [Paenibacillus amylolyticus]|nr:ATP-grasp domain-containing protein [Paenibacillus amylolyticus]WFR63239.1 ATP-grasp domain-containing protein [Paenibacillus amylolyticus]